MCVCKGEGGFALRPLGPLRDTLDMANTLGTRDTLDSVNTLDTLDTSDSEEILETMQRPQQGLVLVRHCRLL